MANSNWIAEDQKKFKAQAHKALEKAKKLEEERLATGEFMEVKVNPYTTVIVHKSKNPEKIKKKYNNFQDSFSSRSLINFD